MSALRHISVCICTYKRVEALARLLREFGEQHTDGVFTFSLVIADNDPARSAEPVVAEFAGTGLVPVKYCHEARQNIALARNKALEKAKGEFVAFFDDDQRPQPRWLLTLLQACDTYAVDGALGPVKPDFEATPPAWVIKGKFCERATYPTGFVIDWRKGRTGNVLLKSEIFPKDEPAFSPAFLTGEDQDFFRRMINRGRRFVWCNEAVAFETVPATRWSRRFLIRRALLRGKISLQHPTSKVLEVGKSLVAVPAYLGALPIGALAGQHALMSYLEKLFFHLGRLLGLMNFSVGPKAYVSE